MPNSATALPTLTATYPIQDLSSLGSLPGFSQDAERQIVINDKILSQCPTTRDCLETVNSLSLQIIDESQGMNYKKLLMNGVVFPLIFAATIYGASLYENFSPSNPQSFLVAIENGNYILSRTPEAVLRLLKTHPAALNLIPLATPNDSLPNSWPLMPSSSEIGVLMESAQNPSPAIQITAGAVAAASAMNTVYFAWKFLDRKSFGDAAQKFTNSLPAIKQELTEAKIDQKDIDSITGLFSRQIRNFNSISAQGKQAAWPKFFFSASLATAAAGLCLGQPNLVTGAGLSAIYFGVVDFLKNGVFSKSKGQENAQVKLQERAEKYLI